MYQNEVLTKMQTTKTRLLAITSATLALVIAGGAAVTAAPRDDDRLPGMWGRGGPGVDRMMDRFDRGLWDLGGMRARLGAALDEYSRREVTLVKTDGSTLTSRVDNGTVSGSSEAGLDYALAGGETASVVVDDHTKVFGFSEETIERRGWSRVRLVPSEISLADVETGAAVVVWATSDDGETFLAQRIVVRPADEADEADEADGDTEAAPVGDGEAVEDSASAPVIDA